MRKLLLTNIYQHLKKRCHFRERSSDETKNKLWLEHIKEKFTSWFFGHFLHKNETFYKLRSRSTKIVLLSLRKMGKTKGIYKFLSYTDGHYGLRVTQFGMKRMGYFQGN